MASIKFVENLYLEFRKFSAYENADHNIIHYNIFKFLIYILALWIRIGIDTICNLIKFTILYIWSISPYDENIKNSMVLSGINLFLYLFIFYLLIFYYGKNCVEYMGFN